jgi:Skp family chaperone for outer membrane proteins
MKTAVVALSCLAGVVFVFAAGAAGGNKAVPSTPTIPIGVVRALDILQKDKKHNEEMNTEQTKARAELSALAKEIESQEGELNALKPTSTDYLKLAETLAEKKAHFNAHRNFLEQQWTLKQQQWTQKMFGEIVRASQEVALEKKLPLVLVKDDPNTATQPQALATLIATQKVLYSGGCPDITEEVQAKLSVAKP